MQKPTNHAGLSSDPESAPRQIAFNGSRPTQKLAGVTFEAEICRERTGGFRSCRAALQTQRSTLSITSVCAGEEKGPFPHVAGELGRSLEFGAGLGQSASPKQKVAPRRRQWRIVAQGGGVVDLVYQPQARFGPKAMLWATARLRSTTGEGITARSRS